MRNSSGFADKSNIAPIGESEKYDGEIRIRTNPSKGNPYFRFSLS
jgi:hypothetical protein